MYPFVLFGVITLVVLIILVAANPERISNHLFVSLFVGIVLTFLILYQRAIDNNNIKAKHDLDESMWFFRNV
jgi:uncharacterized membrane protein YqjE